MKWIALFSQSGSEICDLSEAISFKPTLVVTDAKVRGNKINDRIEQFETCFVDYRNMTKQERLDWYRSVLHGADLITLHGWLNIVPKEICNEFKIYNGHPGLITRYSALKGKDPQVRFAENIQDYPFYGSVVHVVTPEVDDGEVVSFCERETPPVLDNYFDKLRETSLEAWIEFFNSLTKINV